MKQRNVIWLAMMLAFIIMLGVQIQRGNIVLGGDDVRAGAFVILAVCVLLVGLFARRFIAESFDQNGEWTGRLFRRRKQRDEFK